MYSGYCILDTCIFSVYSWDFFSNHSVILFIVYFGRANNSASKRKGNLGKKCGGGEVVKKLIEKSGSNF